MSTLDPVQIEALRFAKGKRGVAYFIEMGLGKSLLALEEFQRLTRMIEPAERVTRLVIVTPNTFKSGFLDEIEKHGFAFAAHVFVSGHRSNDKWLAIMKYPAPPVLIVNYEAIRPSSIMLKIITWMRVRPTMLVLDESIQIKSHDSQQTKAALNLALEAKVVRLLSGRPQTQGPQDLYPQLKSIGLFRAEKFWAFKTTFCKMGGWENKQVVGVRNAETLARIMAPVVFQARKSDWLPSLPRKDFTIRSYDMSGEQAAQYAQMRDEFLLELEHEIVAVDVAVSKYEKLSQIQCGFILNEQGDPRELVEPENNPRLAVLLDLLGQIEGKTVVIYRHRYSFEILVRALNEQWTPAFIRGGMKPEEVAFQKDCFNNHPGCRVILGQCDAIKYGHTLLGGEDPRDHCSTMIFFESSYSLDTRTQDEDRIHRRGQRGENCLYIDLSGSDLDRRVVRALQKKENLYEQVFSKLRSSEPFNGGKRSVGA